MSEWQTGHPPTEDDVFEEGHHFVEVTYINGLMGWEPFEKMKDWKGSASTILAWRKVRPAFDIEAHCPVATYKVLESKHEIELDSMVWHHKKSGWYELSPKEAVTGPNEEVIKYKQVVACNKPPWET